MGRSCSSNATLHKINELNELGAQINELKEKITDTGRAFERLTQEKRNLEKKLANPSLVDIMDAKVSQFGRIPHEVLNKTMRTLLLPISSGPARADVLYRHMYGPTQQVALASSITIYLTIVGLVFVLYRGYRRCSESLTITRILFSVDMCFSVVWFLVALWSIALLEDPLVVMRHHNEALMVAVQLLVGCAFLWYLLVRCLSIATTLSSRECFEMVLSLFIIHDYFDRGWAPSIRDEMTSIGPGTYLMYGIGHLVLAARRARRQVLECPVPCSSKCPKCQACREFASDENGMWWCLSQMKCLAAYVEDYCFGTSHRNLMRLDAQQQSSRRKRSSRSRPRISGDVRPPNSLRSGL